LPAPDLKKLSGCGRRHCFSSGFRLLSFTIHCDNGMELDLYIHTNLYSGCSNTAPEKLLLKARDAGLDGIAITEHGIRWPDEKIKLLNEKSGLGNFTVIPGQEVACYSESGRFQGEFLVFGYPRSLGSSRSVQQVADLVHAAGGVLIAAHPFKRMKTGNGFYGCGHEASDLPIDGLEVEHPSYDAESRSMARGVMQSMKIAGIGSSDAHDLRQVGRYRTFFERNVTTAEMLCEEIRCRRLKAMGEFDRR